MVPANYFIIVLPGEVQTIKVGEVTNTVPPGAFKSQGTAATPLVIITILGGKWHTTMSIKGITSGTCKKERKRAPTEVSIFLY